MLYSTTKRFDGTSKLFSRPKQENQPRVKMMKTNSYDASVSNITFGPSLQANTQIQHHQNTSIQMIWYVHDCVNRFLIVSCNLCVLFKWLYRLLLFNVITINLKTLLEIVFYHFDLICTYCKLISIINKNSNSNKI